MIRPHRGEMAKIFQVDMMKLNELPPPWGGAQGPADTFGEAPSLIARSTHSVCRGSIEIRHCRNNDLPENRLLRVRGTLDILRRGAASKS
jgi:hypothetical protein